MRSLWLAVSATLAACSPFPTATTDAGPVAIDSPPPPDAQQCFGSYVSVCFTASTDLPTTARVLTSDISTEDTQICDQHNQQATGYCVIAGMGIRIAAGTAIRAYGSRPLVLVSTTTVDLDGTLDVSSTSSSVAVHPDGPGVTATAIASCADAAIAPTASSGGAGGSFGGQGGNGQHQDSTTQPTAGAAVSFPAALRAGCPGQAGNSVDGSAPGVGGHGGGAVSIIASAIHLTGAIDASGAAGLAGPLGKSGGGGGGSGGMIVLDAPTIATGAAFLLFANGGGGAQGSAGTGTGSGAGQPGGESTGPLGAGAGGKNISTAGGAGGDGAAGTLSKDGANAATNLLGGNAGGGGGGGAAGFIHAPGITSNLAPASTDP
jgi:hypothetical protein